MIRYLYTTQKDPPAPFVHVTLRNTTTGQERANLPAQVDHGADITVIPSRLADALDLPRVRMLPVKGFGEHPLLLPTILVEITIRQMQPVPMEALLSPDEPHVILGRDLLNRYRVVLDGRQLALELD
jgi:predicted aspartyl protease